MAKNPLLKSRESAWTAMDYYHRAVELGKGEHARLWLAEAKRRGEIIDHSEPRSER